jgi:hypothetical protein
VETVGRRPSWGPARLGYGPPFLFALVLIGKDELQTLAIGIKG